MNSLLSQIQFFWCVVHMGIIVFKPDCEYPRWTAAVFLPQNLFMLILFIDFYIKAYVKKPVAKVNHAKEESSALAHLNGKQSEKTCSNGTHKSELNSKGNANGTAYVNGSVKPVLNRKEKKSAHNKVNKET